MISMYLDTSWFNIIIEVLFEGSRKYSNGNPKFLSEIFIILQSYLNYAYRFNSLQNMTLFILQPFQQLKHFLIKLCT